MLRAGDRVLGEELPCQTGQDPPRAITPQPLLRKAPHGCKAWAVWPGERTRGEKQGKENLDTLTLSGSLVPLSSAQRDSTPNGDKLAWGEPRSGGKEQEPWLPRLALESQRKLWQCPPHPWEPSSCPTWTPFSPAASAAEPRCVYPGCREERFSAIPSKVASC